jgi:hypothetical protein
MRTTLNIPDDVARNAKLRAVEESRTLTDLIVEGLHLRLARSVPTRILPVSAARGGLLPGVEWHKLEGVGQEDFR